jgi:hypothetical protein
MEQSTSANPERAEVDEERVSFEGERSPPNYEASLSSLDGDESEAPRNESFVSSMYDSFAPATARLPLQETAPEVTTSLDLALALRGQHVQQQAAEIATQSGYLSDSTLQLPRTRNSASTEHLYQPQGPRVKARKGAGPALKHALANQGTIAPGQPGRVRRVKDKVLKVDLRDQGSDEVCCSLPRGAPALASESLVRSCALRPPWCA